jgi:hypothetical protein
MEMPPLTSPDRALSPACWRLLLVVACVLVFGFALHAKVAVYGHTAQPHASTASKLWVDGKKVDFDLPRVSSVLFYLAALLLVFSQQFEHRPYVHNAIPASALNRQYLHRFLRPPPPSFQ